MFNLGPLEIFLILVVVLIIFGPGKLPYLGSALGKGIREFRQAVGGEKDSLQEPAQREADDKESVQTTSAESKEADK